jgi:hypothetical protein
MSMSTDKVRIVVGVLTACLAVARVMLPGTVFPGCR